MYYLRLEFSKSVIMSSRTKKPLQEQIDMREGLVRVLGYETNPYYISSNKG